MDTKTKDPVTPKRHEIYLDRRYYNIPSAIENKQAVFLNRTPEYLVRNCIDELKESLETVN